MADLAPVVDGIAQDQLHQPTPCAELDVEQLRNHMLGWLTTFAAGFADPDGQAPRANIEGTERRPMLRTQSAQLPKSSTTLFEPAPPRVPYAWGKTPCQATSRSA